MFHEGAELDKWKEDGVLYILNGRTKQKMPHYIQFYDNFIKNKKRLRVKNAVKKMMIPHLIVHGDKDLSVPFVMHKTSTIGICLVNSLLFQNLIMSLGHLNHGQKQSFR